MVTKAYKKRRIGTWALTSKYLTPGQLEIVEAKMKLTNQQFGQICIEEGFLDEEKLAELLARQSDYEYVELKGIKDPQLFKIVPVELMTTFQFVPYEQTDQAIKIAIANPDKHFETVDALEMLLDMDIEVVVASERKIRELLKKIEASQSVLNEATGDMGVSLVKETETGDDVLSIEKISVEESPIVKLVDSTILDAISKKASDIHVESAGEGVIIRYRIDGMLYQATDPIDIKHKNAIISRIKVMSELDISEKRIPQDGRFKLNIRDRYIDFRVSILPSIHGENAVIRILDRESLSASSGDFHLDGMGLPMQELKRIRRLIHAPYGMFLMTGPTGSGKTTTLYRALSEVNKKDVKVITIEDPVEYQLKGTVQIPVNEKKGLTFASGLRAILRHDPDTILLGEIRDAETAQIALQSALTGHLVFTTVHANSSFEVINRFIHMGVDPYNLMSALNCIVAQRLIRTLCECKTKVKLTGETLAASGLDAEAVKNTVFFEAKGCELCKGTGFSGRQAIIELIEIDDDMRSLVIDRARVATLKKKAAEMGTIFLRTAAIREVLSGTTTLKEANRITFIDSTS